MPEYQDGHLLDINRVGKITASLGAAIMGIDPYTSRQEAWRRITGCAKPFKPNPYMLHGMDNEATALEAFEAETGILITPGRFIPHPTIPWLGASPDSITACSKIPVEVKCPQTLHMEVPAHYNVQVQIQIECLNAPYGYFYSWHPEHDYGFCERVYRDKEYFDIEIYPALLSFYVDYVDKNVIPPRAKRSKLVKQGE